MLSLSLSTASLLSNHWFVGTQKGAQAPVRKGLPAQECFERAGAPGLGGSNIFPEVVHYSWETGG